MKVAAVKILVVPEYNSIGVGGSVGVGVIARVSTSVLHMLATVMVNVREFFPSKNISEAGCPPT